MRFSLSNFISVSLSADENFIDMRCVLRLRSGRQEQKSNGQQKKFRFKKIPKKFVFFDRLRRSL